MRGLFMFFYLKKIAPLLKDMRHNNVKQDKFSFTYNNVEFDIVVLIEREPFELLFGIIDYNFSFTLNLYKGYKLEYIPDDVFWKLCRILNLRPGKEGLTSFKFLKFFSERIPKKYSGKTIQPHQIAVYKKDIPDSEKIYFKGWRTHISDGRTAQNFDKTRALLGDKAYDFCKENNISSCWSDKPNDRVDYYPPEDYLKRKSNKT